MQLFSNAGDNRAHILITVTLTLSYNLIPSSHTMWAKYWDIWFWQSAFYLNRYTALMCLCVCACVCVCVC